MFSACLLSYVDEVLTAGIERHRDQPPASADIPVSHREDPRPCVPHSSPRRGDVEDAADLADAGGRAAECSRGTVGCYHGQVYLVAFCIVLYFALCGSIWCIYVLCAPIGLIYALRAFIHYASTQPVQTTTLLIMAS